MNPVASAKPAPDSIAAGDAADVAILASADAASRDVATLAEENAGLAEELLRCYEQLNLVFRVSEKAASLHDATGIVVEMLGDLGSILGASEVWFEPAVDNFQRVYLTRDAGDQLERRADAPDLPSEITTLGTNSADTNEAEADASGRTVVCATSPNVLVGSIVSPDEVLGTVVLKRPIEATEFISNELLLAESVLGYAGHILENIRLYDNVKRMSVEVVRSLVNAIDKKDHYTSSHSDRVGYFARMIGRRLGMRPRDLEELEWAALLHDIGKIGVRQEILSKPGKLTDAEYVEMKQHPRMSYEVLKPIESFRSVLRGVLFHHENYDGSGYPYGLSGDDIPLFGRIIHVVDVFDALTSDRSYRAAFSWEKGLEIIENEAGTKLDPRIAECFLQAIRDLDPDTRRMLEERSHGDPIPDAVSDRGAQRKDEAPHG